MGTKVIRAIPALRKRVLQARADGLRVGCVPTMGALHAGHVALFDRARADCDFLVATLFVNPLQFDRDRRSSKLPTRHRNGSPSVPGLRCGRAVRTLRCRALPATASCDCVCRRAGLDVMRREPSRAFSRGRDRGAEDSEHCPARVRLLRREGLPAARDHPTAGRGHERPGRSGGSPDRSGAGRPGAQLPQRAPQRGREGGSPGARADAAGGSDCHQRRARRRKGALRPGPPEPEGRAAAPAGLLRYRRSGLLAADGPDRPSQSGSP